MTGGKALPSALLEQMLTQTDGVPLFIEEVDQVGAGERGRARGGRGLRARRAVAQPGRAHRPCRRRSSRGSIGSTAARTLAQTSAALGREFSYEVLKAVTALTDAELEPSSRQLVASELVHQRGSAPHAGYIFKHALVQDAAYETMLKSQRSRVHRRIVDVFERDFPETASAIRMCWPTTAARRASRRRRSTSRSGRPHGHRAIRRRRGPDAQVERAMGLLSAISDGSSAAATRGATAGRTWPTR